MWIFCRLSIPTEKWAARLLRLMAQKLEMLGNASNEDDLGINFGATLTQKKLNVN